MATKAKATVPAADEPEFKDLRVLEFGVENFMRVRAVVIRPEGSVVNLTGKNRQGKTSVIRALRSVFTGKRALPGDPIRRGETDARVWTVLGHDGKPELTIEEQLSKRDDGEFNHKLVVTPAEGRPYRDPQKTLAALYDPIGFAPFDFSRMEPKKQLEVVKGLVPGIDFDDLAARRLELFEDRTQIGRERDRAEARHQGIMVPVGTPETEISVGDLVAQMAQASEHNALIGRRRQAREDAADERDRALDEIEQLQAKIKTLQARANELDVKINSAEPLPDPVDVSSLERQIAAADATNAQVRILRGKMTARDEHRRLAAEYDAKTRSIADIDDEKAAAIENAKLPIPGLGLTDDGLTLNGLPFDQASGREKLETAVRIGMALNPSLKLIVAEEGSLLDDEGLATLEALAEKHNFLVVLERVTNGESGAFVIEDGSLVS